MVKEKKKQWGLRSLFFWIHFSLGVIAGLVIALQCLTGFFMSYQKEILAFAERGSQRISVPEKDSQRMFADQLLLRAQGQEPDLAFTKLTVFTNPTRAWLLGYNRRDFHYINPYSGDILYEKAQKWRSFFRFNLFLHRWLALEGDKRSIGRQIMGVSNLIFIALSVLGLILWWPKRQTWRQWKSALWVRGRSNKRPRAYHFHRVFGFWGLWPLMIVLLTGAVFSYDWASSLTDEILGPRDSRGLTEQEKEIVENLPTRGAVLTLEQQIDAISKGIPHWDSINLALPLVGNKKGGPEKGAKKAPIRLIEVQETGVWFPLSPSRLLLDPHSGEILSARRAGSMSLAQKIRASIRTLHTGEAGLWIGKTIAAISCLIGIMLCYTGYSLSCKRVKKRLQQAKKP